MISEEERKERVEEILDALKSGTLEVILFEQKGKTAYLGESDWTHRHDYTDYYAYECASTLCRSAYIIAGNHAYEVPIPKLETRVMDVEPSYEDYSNNDSCVKGLLMSPDIIHIPDSLIIPHGVHLDPVRHYDASTEKISVPEISGLTLKSNYERNFQTFDENTPEYDSKDISEKAKNTIRFLYEEEPSEMYSDKRVNMDDFSVSYKRCHGLQRELDPQVKEEYEQLMAKLLEIEERDNWREVVETKTPTQLDFGEELEGFEVDTGRGGRRGQVSNSVLRAKAIELQSLLDEKARIPDTSIKKDEQDISYQE